MGDKRNPESFNPAQRENYRPPVRDFDTKGHQWSQQNVFKGAKIMNE